MAARDEGGETRDGAGPAHMGMVRQVEFMPTTTG